MLNRRNLLTSLVAAPLGLKIADAGTSPAVLDGLTRGKWGKKITVPSSHDVEKCMADIAASFERIKLHRAQDANLLHEVANQFYDVLTTDDGREVCVRIPYEMAGKMVSVLRQVAERIRSQDYSESLSDEQSPSDAHASFENGQMVLRYPTDKYLLVWDYTRYEPAGYVRGTDRFVWIRGLLVNLRNGRIYE